MDSPARGPRRLVLVVSLAMLGLGACAPVNEGPVLGKVPEGLAYNSTIQAARKPLPNRAVLRQIAYLRPGGVDWTTSVIITEYSGATDAAEVQRARDAYAARYRSEEYSELQSFAVDGRPAWGWYETERTKGRMTNLQISAVVAYKTVSYSIEVSTRDPRLQSESWLREIAMSFHIAKRERSDAVVLIVAGLVLGLLTWVTWRASEAARKPPADTVDRLLG